MFISLTFLTTVLCLGGAFVSVFQLDLTPDSERVMWNNRSIRAVILVGIYMLCFMAQSLLLKTLVLG